MTEILLDAMKHRSAEFMQELNEYYSACDIEFPTPFTKEDMHKIAFWMATGAGKTLISHINYYQFFHYELFEPNGIIFLTPNEGLSRQHYDELLLSGIPAVLYDGSIPLSIGKEHTVLVMEITKLVEEKSGGGLTRPVSEFEGPNLIFVDEGHKGKKSEDQKWAHRRDLLAKDGFVFEYSATFGQILNKNNPVILSEYGKSIIFNYSYHYFYLDNYGKDFSILNIQKDTSLADTSFHETMLVAGLLSYYEQILAYEQNKRLAQEHNLEKPLWVFVGTTVTGKNEQSDVVQMIGYFKRVIQEPAWLESIIQQILWETKQDIFQDRFKYLRESFAGSEDDLLDDLYQKVFGGKGSFSIYELRHASGELGLQVGENPYFGVVNIGSAADLKKELEKTGLEVKLDALSGSLFQSIKKEHSEINILLGSKKFIEGWDTWRVSSMGLINIGTGQGPQIVQLFGRGVRLKGKDMSLQRSGTAGAVKLLETLNIYGFKADYLTRFLEAINKEDVDLETIVVPVNAQKEDKWNDLYTLTADKKRRFEHEVVVNIDTADLPYPKLDLTPKVYAYLAAERKKGGLAVAEVQEGIKDVFFPAQYVDLLNWQRIYAEIYRFKEQKGYWNLVFSQLDLRNVLLSERCRLSVLPDILHVSTQDDLVRLEDIAIMAIKKLLESYYKSNARRFASKHMTYEKLNPKQLSLFTAEEGAGYILQIDKKKKELINSIRGLANELNSFMQKEGLENGELPRVYYDRHLFVPLLLNNSSIEQMTPAGLTESEGDFVLGLIDYLKNYQERLGSTELYLLRNMPKSGVGFFNLSGFYPDFILWLKDRKRQLIAFIDPKGLIFNHNIDNEKIQLHKEIKDIEQARKKKGWKNIRLESFILSPTSYAELVKKDGRLPSKDEYKQNHVLFMEDENWPEQLITKLLQGLKEI